MNDVVDVLVTKLDDQAVLPARTHPGDAGFDLCTLIDVTIRPRERLTVPTGLAIALPPGFVALVHPRSGLARNFGVTLTNSPGTIDAGYRGPIDLLLVNLDETKDCTLSKGDRVAQLVIQEVPEVIWHEVSKMPETHRGGGGFGSSGF